MRIMILSPHAEPETFARAGASRVLLDGLDRAGLDWALHHPAQPRPDLRRFDAVLAWPYGLRHAGFLAAAQAFEPRALDAGVPVVNSLSEFSIRHSRGLWRWQGQHVPCARFRHVAGPEDNPFGYPVVLRVDGVHRGRGAYRVHSAEQAAAAFADSRDREGMPPLDLAVEYVETRYPDGMYRKRRAIVVGGRLLPRQHKVSADWKVNLGAATALGVAEDAEFMRRGEEHEALVLRAARALGADVVAVDYTPLHGGGCVFWEGNWNFDLTAERGSRWDQFRAATGRTDEECQAALDRVGDALAHLVMERASDATPALAATA
jgi:hypothetical protein